MTLSRRGFVGCVLGGLSSAAAGSTARAASAPAASAAEGALLSLRTGLALLGRQAGAAGSRNALVAPTSLTTALAMAASGSTGRTAAAIDPPRALESLGLLNRALLSDAGPVEISIANAMFVARDAKLRAAFAEALKAKLEARIEAVDFAAPGTLAGINTWYAGATRGLIDPMLDQLPGSTRFVLGSAVAFKGAWLSAFDAKETRRRNFVTAAGRERQVEMMAARERTLLYRRTARFEAVRMVYAGAAYEMVLALPREEAKLDLAQWLARARDVDWKPLLERDGYAPRPGFLALPKLQLAMGGDVKAQIARDPVFGALVRPGAELGGIAEERLEIDRIVHRTLVRMDEQGTEAAGATAVVGTRSALDRPQRPFRMIVDRPYVFAIRHVPTGAVTFAGYVADPPPLR